MRILFVFSVVYQAPLLTSGCADVVALESPLKAVLLFVIVVTLLFMLASVEAA